MSTIKMSRIFKMLVVMLLAIAVQYACQPSKEIEEVYSQAQEVEAVAVDYFATFAERADWEKLCSF